MRPLHSKAIANFKVGLGLRKPSLSQPSVLLCCVCGRGKRDLPEWGLAIGGMRVD